MSVVDWETPTDLSSNQHCALCSETLEQLIFQGGGVSSNRPSWVPRYQQMDVLCILACPCVTAFLYNSNRQNLSILEYCFCDGL